MLVEHFPVGPLQCNCVIVADPQTRSAFVVDPGDDVDRILAVLARHNLRVGGILATHAHIDHVGGLASLARRTGAPTLLHEADLPLYQALAEQARWLGVPVPDVGSIDRFVSDAQRLPCGRHHLRVLHTPGHTPGSISLVVDDERPLVLSGDTLFAGSIGRTDLWGGSLTDILHSIRTKLLTMEDEIAVLPGHGPATTIGTERRSNPFLVTPL